MAQPRLIIILRPKGSVEFMRFERCEWRGEGLATAPTPLPCLTALAKIMTESRLAFSPRLAGGSLATAHVI